ncbi:caldesmon-like isoform X2 [Lytechinus variegatus]|uniref:caldesmon-like isoform X2 n=2 Tax=Lytechinus variegatus TaxID=7654 RepID=UPI001BB1B6AF|nr:caldesmon-like isoform X2 [Lytechinus variegatus]
MNCERVLFVKLSVHSSLRSIMSFQEEWERKKEERQRKRTEMDGGLSKRYTYMYGSVSPPTKTSHVIVPSVQLKQTPKSPTAMKNNNLGEKPLNEAEKKAEELRQKREQERIEAEQRAKEEIITSVTLDLDKKEEIRRAREERERQEMLEAEERKARAEVR